MDNYLVTFVFDVDADSPDEAARTAKAMAQTDPGFWPSSASAHGTAGPRAEIDLAAEPYASDIPVSGGYSA